ncbi:cobyrinate a,c-diamide synthase [Rhodoferax sp. GW822-FHT02A01]|uniref:cobyrinate a,c-diamide synthase n=1 Tax=Rhodoferax sp. GW822-FHT02A01 TaxID=3141537 RepID=UPI00315C6BE5
MPSTRCPAILVAAPASGQGKTTITSALARLHARQGRRVRVFKCGPDFLDPYWHTLASGAPVYQLDLWMTGEEDCQARLTAAAHEADLIIVEGVMGLYDGEPSAADLAQRFGLHVLAVVDASAMAGTFGALAFGLQHYRKDLPWAGVLANRVASTGHAYMLRNAIPEARNWLGAVMRNADMTLPERHLGLTVASEVPDAMARLDAAADALQDTPLGQMSLQDLRRWDTEFPLLHDARAVPALLAGKTIAIARDAAFCFIYTANLDCLQSMGATLRFFSPLANEAVPDCDAVWLPGGYPELHADRIAGSAQTRSSLAQHIAAAKPVWAECGGMMALFETLVTTDGQTHALWGLLPGEVTMHTRLAALGPQQLELATGLLRGHTFHYSTTETTLQPVARTARPQTEPSPQAGEALWQQGAVRASYFHAWFPSSPTAAASLFLPTGEVT